MADDDILVRQFQKQDLQDYMAYAALPAVYGPALATPPTDAVSAARIISQTTDNGRMYAVVLRHLDQVIGDVQLTENLGSPDDMLVGVMDLGYELHPDYWNHGYMTAALRQIVSLEFSLHEVQAIRAATLVDNQASAAVLAKLGFDNYVQVKQHYPVVNGKFNVDISENLWEMKAANWHQ